VNSTQKANALSLFPLATMSDSEAILEETILNLKTSACSLETLPTSFFQKCVEEADLLEVVNASLLSGTFPETTVVKLLLKKRVIWRTQF